jgi:hypothetical protein
MKALIRGLLGLALVAATAACDGSPTAGSVLVSSNDGSEAVESPGVLTFTSTPSQTEQRPQTASGGIAGIDFAGALVTGTPCYTVAATHGTRNNSVTVTVTGTSTGGICAQVVTYHNYTGRVSALLPGTYTFTVIHRVGANTTTAFTGTVTVQ